MSHIQVIRNRREWDFSIVSSKVDNNGTLPQTSEEKWFSMKAQNSVKH